MSLVIDVRAPSASLSGTAAQSFEEYQRPPSSSPLPIAPSLSSADTDADMDADRPTGTVDVTIDNRPPSGSWAAAEKDSEPSRIRVSGTTVEPLETTEPYRHSAAEPEGCWGACLWFRCGTRSRNKVPRATALFWLVKIIATTFGEVLSDTMDGGMPAGTGMAVSGVVFVALVILNLAVDHYVPSLYWTTIAIISVVGTQLTDMTDYPQAEVPCGVLLLCAIFYFWHRSQGTLDIRTIFVRRREAYYWFAVVITFWTGTALGDLMSEQAGLTDWESCLFFCGLFCLVVFFWQLKRLGPVLAFWLAYVLTRPIGTNLGDYLETQMGGSNYVTLTFGGALAIAMIGLTITGYDTADEEDETPQHAPKVEALPFSS